MEYKAPVLLIRKKLRRITLGNIKDEEIRASFENGVLKLQLLKEEKRSVNKKQIDIQ